MSPIVRGGDPALEISIRVAGWKQLYLMVNDAGDYHHDVANWGEARLIDKDGVQWFLDELDPKSARQQWGEFRRNNRSTVGGPLQIGDRAFARGLGTHAKSVIHYELDRAYEWFVAFAGVDVSRGSNGSVRFIVSEEPSEEKPLNVLWTLLDRDFSDPASQREMRLERRDGIWDTPWETIAELAGRYARAMRGTASTDAAARAGQVADASGLWALRSAYHRSCAIEEAVAELKEFNHRALRLAINDLTQKFGAHYTNGTEYLRRLDKIEQTLGASALDHLHENGAAVLVESAAKLRSLFREALLANPLLNSFDELLLVRRKADRLGLPANWQGNSSLPRTGFDNEIAVLSRAGRQGASPWQKLRSVYKPAGGRFVGDLELHFDADRLMFSSIGTHDRWQVFEIRTDGSALRQVTPGDQPDVDNYDGCYLPDGAVIFCSTASFVGVPCVDGSDHVATLYRLERDGKTIRQLCFDQDHNWSPTLLPDGRVLYQRWEYADTPHSQTRLLFQMNPDGTGQIEFYGSNSYWPNAMFYARPIPGHASRVVAIVSGHHGVPRMGELVIFDRAKGRHETSGVVQRIPGHSKKVEPVIRDQLVDGSWPKFLHPFPLSENYFIVAAKPKPESPWGIYLVDVFDNMLLLAEEPGHALLEPVPIRKSPRPPVIPDKVDMTRKDAVVQISDIYYGAGLKGIPRGTVKELRVFAYHWAYQGMGGLLGTIGMDGPWDIRRILGTVPVSDDGSALFQVPANTPISIQPLDSEGRAVQLMRSWMTAMPGENVSCIGCHEQQEAAPPNYPARSQVRAHGERTPDEIKPWYGPARGFSYAREVQSVIDKYCVRCHDDQQDERGEPILDLRGTAKIADFRLETPGRGERLGGRFSVSYANLHRYVRRPGIESDYHLLMPMEFHASTTELVQMLKKGHYGVALDREAWDRLYTWIDLNAPYHGSWGEELDNPGKQTVRRRELRKLYAGMDDEDAEVIPAAASNCKPTATIEQVNHVVSRPEPRSSKRRDEKVANRVDPVAAPPRHAANGPMIQRTVDLGNGVSLKMVRVPPGEFEMGDAASGSEKRTATRRIRIKKPFWMGSTELNNEQYAQFDPTHDSHVESKTAYQFGIHGLPVNEPKQPVVRVSWEQAMAFCAWLSKKTGEAFTLPTETQWEYACRAGTATAFWFGSVDADFSRFANLADAKLTEFASDPYTVFTPLKNPSPYEDYIPRELRFDDKGLVSVPVGRYEANPWGLHDMHGNVWEWTRSSYSPRFEDEDDGGNAFSGIERSGGQRTQKVVRGGSWRDRPFRGTSSYRLAYDYWQGVFNVGFRVVCEADD